MTRKIIATITVALLALALLPAGVAFASADSTARLTAGVEVFPGSAQSFAIQVNNTESTGLPGFGFGAGSRIRSVEFILPSNSGIRTAAGGYSAPDGWTVHPGDGGFLQTVTFVADGEDTGSNGIAPGGNLTFEFPADVLRPLDGDRTGEFQVWVSDTRSGASQSRADATNGTLTSTVRVLEVLPGTLGAIAPPGATDGSGTAGQEIEYAFRIFNHARSDLTVQPNLTSSNSGDQITQGDPVSIPANGDGELSSTVVLGPTSNNNDRQSTFTAQGNATDATPSAQSTIAQAVFVVNALTRLELDWDSFTPTHVQSEDPVSYTFRVNATKRGTQGLTLEEGTLQFCNNTVALQTPVSFGAGTQPGTLEFGPTTIDFDGDRTECDAFFDMDGEDGNDHPTAFEFLRARLITIDNLIPVIELEIILPLDEDDVQQTMAKDGDDIEVEGTIDTGCETLDSVALQFPDGGPIAFADARAGEVSCSNGSFNVTFEDVEFPGVERDGEFLAVGQGTSLADRPGTGSTEENSVIDNWTPVFDEARTIIIDQGPYQGSYGVLVNFDENNELLGACSTRVWNVSGHGNPISGNNPDAVLFSNGQPCERGEAGPDNDRILVIDDLANRDETMDVRYNADRGPQLLRTDRAKDGAGHFSVERTLHAVVGILPPLPDVLEVTRNNGTETATFDEDKYWTRFSGNDLEARIGRARVNYFIEVLTGTIDAEDNCIPGSRLSIQSADGEDDWTPVPIGADEGDYVRAIRLQNDAGIGPARCITVALDQTAPEIAGAVINPAGTQVDVTLSEPVLGPHLARSWYAWEHAEHRDDQPIGGRDYYGVKTVSGQREERQLEVDMPNPSEFGGVDYRFPLTEPESNRLVDRAGNALANTVNF